MFFFLCIQKAMYSRSDKATVAQLVGLLISHEVTRVVLCPGSRNAPIVHTICQNPAFQVMQVTDERSAGFCAIGWYQSAQAPVAVVCSSGSALLNLHSAVSEAFYRHIPLIVISADRPEKWIGQMDGQTLPQKSVFGSLVLKSVHISEVEPAASLHFANRLINEALLACTWQGGGPVHINVPIGEPLFTCTEEALPAVRKIEQYAGLTPQLREQVQHHPRIMLLMGQRENRPSAIYPRHRFDWVMLADHLSNRHPDEYIPSIEVLLASVPPEQQQALQPTLVITLQGHILSKRLKQWLRRLQGVEHWHVSDDGCVADLFEYQTKAIACNCDVFMQQLSEVRAATNSSYRAAFEACLPRLHAPRFQRGALAAIALLAAQLPLAGACRLHLSNSNSVRFAQFVTLPNNVTVHSNRGVNGIDGSLSTAVACALTLPNELHLLLIGDLSFYYDINILFGRELPPNLRILLFNNAGGGIFYGLAGMPTQPPSEHFIMGTHPLHTASSLTPCMGMRYFTCDAGDPSTLACTLQQWMSPEVKEAALLEIITDAREDFNEIRNYYKDLRAGWQ